MTVDSVQNSNSLKVDSNDSIESVEENDRNIIVANDDTPQNEESFEGSLEGSLEESAESEFIEGGNGSFGLSNVDADDTFGGQEEKEELRKKTSVPPLALKMVKSGNLQAAGRKPPLNVSQSSNQSKASSNLTANLKSATPDKRTPNLKTTTFNRNSRTPSNRTSSVKSMTPINRTPRLKSKVPSNRTSPQSSRAGSGQFSPLKKLGITPYKHTLLKSKKKPEEPPPLLSKLSSGKLASGQLKKYKSKTTQISPLNLSASNSQVLRLERSAPSPEPTPLPSVERRDLPQKMLSKKMSSLTLSKRPTILLSKSSASGIDKLTGSFGVEGGDTKKTKSSATLEKQSTGSKNFDKSLKPINLAQVQHKIPSRRSSDYEPSLSSVSIFSEKLSFRKNAKSKIDSRASQDVLSLIEMRNVKIFHEKLQFRRTAKPIIYPWNDAFIKLLLNRSLRGGPVPLLGHVNIMLNKWFKNRYADLGLPLELNMFDENLNSDQVRKRVRKFLNYNKAHLSEENENENETEETGSSSVVADDLTDSQIGMHHLDLIAELILNSDETSIGDVAPEIGSDELPKSPSKVSTNCFSAFLPVLNLEDARVKQFLENKEFNIFDPDIKWGEANKRLKAYQKSRKRFTPDNEHAAEDESGNIRWDAIAPAAVKVMADIASMTRQSSQPADDLLNKLMKLINSKAEKLTAEDILNIIKNFGLNNKELTAKEIKDMLSIPGVPSSLNLLICGDSTDDDMLRKKILQLNELGVIPTGNGGHKKDDDDDDVDSRELDEIHKDALLDLIDQLIASKAVKNPDIIKNWESPEITSVAGDRRGSKRGSKRENNIKGINRKGGVGKDDTFLNEPYGLNEGKSDMEDTSCTSHNDRRGMGTSDGSSITPRLIEMSSLDSLNYVRKKLRNLSKQYQNKQFQEQQQQHIYIASDVGVGGRPPTVIRTKRRIPMKTVVETASCCRGTKTFFCCC